jgi:outer membrane protein TolC
MNEPSLAALALALLAAVGTAAEPATAAPAKLGLREALAQALERDPELRARRLAPDLARTGVDSARAAFDPTASAEASAGRTATPLTPADNLVGDREQAKAGVEALLPTGTTVGISGALDRARSDGAAAATSTARAGLSVNQALLRGFGLDANLVGVRQARLDVEISQYELRGYVSELAATVETTYWDLLAAGEQVGIVERSLAVARDQFEQVRVLIQVGRLAEVELAAAEAEVAVRASAAIDARFARDSARLRLLRLLAAPPGQEFTLNDAVQPPAAEPVDAAEHVQVALRLRPDLNQARLQRRRGDLELVRTRDGLLPKLDLFATLGRSGYAAAVGGSLHGEDGKGWDAAIGLRFSHQLGNRAAEAANRRAALSLEQVQESIANLENLAATEVRTACLELVRARDQIAATAATSRLQGEKARVEREKLRVGKSTALLVAQAERDWFQAQVAELQAAVRQLKDAVELYRLDGSLLERRGIAAAGGQPPE